MCIHFPTNKSQTQWHRPNCNPLGPASCQNRSAVLLCTGPCLSGGYPGLPRSLVNWLLEASQHAFGLGQPWCSVNTNPQLGSIWWEKDARGHTWLKFTSCMCSYVSLSQKKKPFNKRFVCVCFKKPLQIVTDEKTYFANITAKKNPFEPKI